MDALNPQLRPLEVNPKTGEPFLRLISHKNIILTPARLDDGPAMITYFNDERVYQWLRKNAEWSLKQAKQRQDEWLAELEAARDDPILKVVDFCPVGSIREVQEDGTEIFIGDIKIGLAQHPWELEGTGRLEQGMPRSDPDIWTFGNYLAPSHHGRGIMSDVIQTIIQKWAIPRMGVRRMVVTVFEGNAGSVRVLEKNGFTFRETIAACAERCGVCVWLNGS
ncbi:acyl-CoA N-acyltransferase [Mycena alexandri]|uniref:Acyl-CoA N-acyltransferase n=1 Tax=Mycena alexandri TaxID=1745969 RepID=A0AAD6SJ79_9AGAR|nr:acyl-CoA N-acyltransferase [Mycena alexandri]